MKKIYTTPCITLRDYHLQSPVLTASVTNTRIMVGNEVEVEPFSTGLVDNFGNDCEIYHFDD